MGKITQWESKIDDKNYTFSHEKLGGLRDIHNLSINGFVIEIPSCYKSGSWAFLGGGFKAKNCHVQRKLNMAALTTVQGHPLSCIIVPQIKKITQAFLCALSCFMIIFCSFYPISLNARQN